MLRPRPNKPLSRKPRRQESPNLKPIRRPKKKLPDRRQRLRLLLRLNWLMLLLKKPRLKSRQESKLPRLTKLLP
jgi:hypothetical protein